jgi:hypothetical protein
VAGALSGSEYVQNLRAGGGVEDPTGATWPSCRVAVMISSKPWLPPAANATWQWGPGVSGSGSGRTSELLTFVGWVSANAVPPPNIRAMSAVAASRRVRVRRIDPSHSDPS